MKFYFYEWGDLGEIMKFIETIIYMNFIWTLYKVQILTSNQ